MVKESLVIDEIKKHSIKLNSNDDLNSLVEAAGEAEFVLLGEASHGTSEFYSFRAEITKRLIKEKGFSIIGVEGDWPSCFTINRFIKGERNGTAANALQDFNRWPTWMWANKEVESLISWLKEYNDQSNGNVGFYGIDVYSLWESMEEMVRQLQKISPRSAEKARQAFECFEPFDRRPENYGISAAFYEEDCVEEIIALLTEIRTKKHKLDKLGDETALNLEVNGMVTLNAERYYRAMVEGGPDDWNIRDTHMVSAIEAVKKSYGNSSKVIVWEHNTHIGDARATDMKAEGLVNVGQLLREKYGQQAVFAVGFGTHHGSVIASSRWGDPLKIMEVPKAAKGSWEDLMNRAGAYNKILMFNPIKDTVFNHTFGHRAIGVVYNPEVELLGNYVPSRMAQRYDAFVYLDKTTALNPLSVANVYT